MKRALVRGICRLDDGIRNLQKCLLKEFKKMLWELPSDGAERLLRLAHNRKLPPELRRLVVHLLDIRSWMALSQLRQGAPDSTNSSEEKFGKIKQYTGRQEG